jgi:hypothetical protein
MRIVLDVLCDVSGLVGDDVRGAEWSELDVACRRRAAVGGVHDHLVDGGDRDIAVPPVDGRGCGRRCAVGR